MSRLKIFRFDIPCMEALTAKQSERPKSAEIPLPASPEKNASTAIHRRKRRKGKEPVERALEQAPPPLDAWDHTKAGTSSWKWISLTDSSMSRHPPIFTKDGRCVTVRNTILMIL